MKTIIHKSRRRALQSGICLFLPLVMVVLLQQPVCANTGTVTHVNDTIVINKTQTSKKYKIKIYPGATNEVVFFSASGETGKVYQLFLFDLDGTLVKQTQIRNKQTTLLANFVKGCYTFEVFSDDERIENGTLTVH